ncbi:fatty acid desaturase [Methylophilus sp. 13]|uniref:fatty acid desaturase family protein n=1 Tax=Methylophilus sp. 13 TaxID=2781018 RepID=UPI00188FEE3D|nr:fatty acid desaturase [Methylophilus sp. 13]MBF5040275.1 fatty acid desaturase [Methylophilus sp. 13]
MAAKNKPGFLFAYSYWDVIPVVFGILHFAYLIGMFLWFDRLPWYANVLLGLVYAVSISWNINGISHNFIHNPYFKSEFLNRIFSLLESVTMVFSQTFYDAVHKRHHIGNSDRPDANGNTIDWLSIYRYGSNGEPENVWAYTFKSYFRDDPAEIYREIKKRNPGLARFGVFEILCAILLVLVGFVLNWKFMLFMVPFYYLGHCLSSLNGWYEHWRGNPELPIAWGVSSYSKLYNLIWFNNGYHAEHHYRPKHHWTKMHELHLQIADKQKEAGVHVITWSHGLGFLQPK